MKIVQATVLHINAKYPNLSVYIEANSSFAAAKCEIATVFILLYCVVSQISFHIKRCTHGRGFKNI